jgi:hypothetical protein
MKFNPSHQSYGSGLPLVLFDMGYQSSGQHPREGATPEEIGGSGPASILLQTPPSPPRIPTCGGSTGVKCSSGGLDATGIIVVGVLGLAAYGIYSIVRSKQ